MSYRFLFLVFMLLSARFLARGEKQDENNPYSSHIFLYNNGKESVDFGLAYISKENQEIELYQEKIHTLSNDKKSKVSFNLAYFHYYLYNKFNTTFSIYFPKMKYTTPHLSLELREYAEYKLCATSQNNTKSKNTNSIDLYFLHLFFENNWYPNAIPLLSEENPETAEAYKKICYPYSETRIGILEKTLNEFTSSKEFIQAIKPYKEVTEIAQTALAFFYSKEKSNEIQKNKPPTSQI